MKLDLQLVTVLFMLCCALDHSRLRQKAALTSPPPHRTAIPPSSTTPTLPTRPA